MKEFKYIITDPLGLHARPASLLAMEASKYKCSIMIDSGVKIGNAKKLMSVMSMSIKRGMEVTVTFDGEDEDTAYESIRSHFNEKL